MNILRRALLIATGLLCSSASGIEPPKLIETSPAFWAVGVDPGAQKKVSITFDQQMIPAFTDWLGISSLSPNADLNSTKMSTDRRTFDLKVSLEPGKVYVLALNEKGLQGVGFQSKQGVSLGRHYLVFQTAGAPAPQDAAPRVIRTIPSNGANDVNPATVKSIAITFDVPMNSKKHGMHFFENETAVDVSKAAFQYSTDGKTFTLGYNFKPNTSYRVELNSTQDIGFARTTRIPLWPVRFAFSTSSPQ